MASLAALEERLPPRTRQLASTVPQADAELGIGESLDPAQRAIRSDSEELLALAETAPTQRAAPDVEDIDEDYFDPEPAEEFRGEQFRAEEFEDAEFREEAFTDNPPEFLREDHSSPSEHRSGWASRPRLSAGLMIALVPFSLIVVGAGTMIGLNIGVPERDRVPIVQAAATPAPAESTTPREEAPPAQIAKLDESRIAAEPPAARPAEPIANAQETALSAGRQVTTIPIAPELRAAQAAPVPQRAPASSTAETDNERLAYFPERSSAGSDTARAFANTPAPARTGSVSRPGGRRLIVARDVNLRNSPDNGSAVLGVVKNGTELAVAQCDVWCEVTYQGRRGYIFPSFLKNTDGSAVRKF